jgi:hypothetical protein
MGSYGKLRPFLISELDAGKYSASRPGRFTLVATEQEAGWVLKLVWTFWRREKSLALPRFEPGTVDPVHNTSQSLLHLLQKQLGGKF